MDQEITRALIIKKQWIGCLKMPSDTIIKSSTTIIVEFVDDGITPICPKCGVDAVVDGAATDGNLRAMHDVAFGIMGKLEC